MTPAEHQTAPGASSGPASGPGSGPAPDPASGSQSAGRGHRGSSAAGARAAGPRARPDLPQLAFTVAGIRPLEHAAVPTLAIRLTVTRTGGGPVRSVLLTTAIRIDAARGPHEHTDAAALAPLFGQPEQWATSMRPLTWARLTTVLPPFDDRSHTDLAVPCTGDTEQALRTYFRAVRDADVPLDLLFSGTVFHRDAEGRLATARIPWDTEATCLLPAALWHGLTERYFGPGRWLRVSRGTGERLDAYGAAHGLVDTESSVVALLDAAGPFAAADEPVEAAWTR
ncbi:hypothetical protein GCM10018793_60180 [Streptomyces sulfonofaciens]|uniref:Uncharacterized protein n=1 Tax=Streptomyces sulfonofaciens TaxID=68272 RepID=A0A919GL59_9ACTN|nr:DUF6084 family protein [Streptomyces sulfonofaciens]GHH86810.1 hypothetical protein GCM10018793_60180 [Streptomyces sulfonofaciens]